MNKYVLNMSGPLLRWQQTKNDFLMSKILTSRYKNKKGYILKNHLEIINLIKNNINNNDYLMIKGSNSTGLNKLTNDMKLGKINAL